MPQKNSSVPGGGWGEVIGPIPSGGAVRFQNTGNSAVIVQAFSSQAAAAAASGVGSAEGGVTVWEREGAQLTMALAFPGVANATHLRAFGTGDGSFLAVSHG